MNVRLATGVVAAWLAGDAAGADAVWKIKLYDGFIESVDALVGGDAMDCGFLDGPCVIRAGSRIATCTRITSTRSART